MTPSSDSIRPSTNTRLFTSSISKKKVIVYFTGSICSPVTAIACENHHRKRSRQFMTQRASIVFASDKNLREIYVTCPIFSNHRQWPSPWMSLQTSSLESLGGWVVRLELPVSLALGRIMSIPIIQPCKSGLLLMLQWVVEVPLFLPVIVSILLDRCCQRKSNSEKFVAYQFLEKWTDGRLDVQAEAGNVQIIWQEIMYITICFSNFVHALSGCLWIPWRVTCQHKCADLRGFAQNSVVAMYCWGVWKDGFSDQPDGVQLVPSKRIQLQRWPTNSNPNQDTHEWDYWDDRVDVEKVYC